MFNYIFEKQIITSHRKISDSNYVLVTLTQGERNFGYVDEKGKVKINTEKLKLSQKGIES